MISEPISVDQNVMWNSRTVAVYMEDGNEMNNTISYNVGICARDDHCAARGLHWQDAGEGGIATSVTVSEANCIVTITVDDVSTKGCATIGETHSVGVARSPKIHNPARWVPWVPNCI